MLYGASQADNTKSEVLSQLLLDEILTTEEGDDTYTISELRAFLEHRREVLVRRSRRAPGW